MATRPRHPRKEIEAAVEYAIQCGWRHAKATGHAWGRLQCPWNDADCRCGTVYQISIWSTPKNPENHARQIIRLIDGCARKMNNKARTPGDDDG